MLAFELLLLFLLRFLLFLCLGEPPRIAHAFIEMGKQAGATVGFHVDRVQKHRIDTQHGRRDDRGIYLTFRLICLGVDGKTAALGNRIVILYLVESRIIGIGRPLRLLDGAAGLSNLALQIVRLSRVVQAGKIQRGVNEIERHEGHEGHGQFFAVEQHQTLDPA